MSAQHTPGRSLYASSCYNRQRRTWQATAWSVVVEDGFKTDHVQASHVTGFATPHEAERAAIAKATGSAS